ncbi:MAG: M28 family peptidase [Paludibacteraceae bacterium]|nr:M28 family peptidase [Paludibacteraceae bacterium]
MMKTIQRAVLAIILAATTTMSLKAQNQKHYEEIIGKLASPAFQGRGYAYDGVRKAAKYVAKEYLKAGVDNVISQPFTINVNTFPGDMQMSVDGKQLKAGSDFTLREFSCGVKGKYKLYYIDTLNYSFDRVKADLAKTENKNAMVVSYFAFRQNHRNDFNKLEKELGKGVIYIWDTPLKYYKAYSASVSAKPIIWVASSFPKDAKDVEFSIDNKFFENYETENVIAQIKGRSNDSCYVFVAHYDHLGNLGRDIYFPGANDNASGTSMIITLAEYYAKHRPDYDIYFISCSGEECGLRGSDYFCNNPLFDLSRIKYLINFDMVGDNNKSMNCEVSKTGMRGLNLLETINKRGQFFESFIKGELSANSDHYPFAQKGVPCILMINENGSTFPYYHTPEDNLQNADYSIYSRLFRLTTDFIEEY